MKASETASTPPNETVTSKQHRRYTYQKALDGRKQSIHGLWARNRSYIARITAEDTKRPAAIAREAVR